MTDQIVNLRGMGSDLTNRSVALYGRFLPGQRESLSHEIMARGGTVARDLMRRSDFFVVGALATALIDSGSLGQRMKSAKARGVPVMGERSFAAMLAGERAEEPTFPLARALAPTALTRDDAEMLAAFDLIALKGEYCRFADAGVIRTAAELAGRRSRADVVRILARARDLAPTGRHKIVIAPDGDAALQWESGLTTLEGQGVLPLDVQHAGVDELFEEAELHEARGELAGAARFYEMCARADKDDPIALYNLGNIHLAEKRHDDAARAYRRALARDPQFVEARYNLALALEATGQERQAGEELRRALDIDPTHPDAMFNLAQILLKAGEIAEAKSFFERYLTLGPPPEWAATARKAITYCAARLLLEQAPRS